MLRSGTIHAISPVEAESGTRTAVTIRNAPGKGVMVWAGLLHPSAQGKPAEQIMAGDYVRRQIVSFCCWDDVWTFYEGHPEFAPLFDELRATVKERIASGANAADPAPGSTAD